VDQALFLQSNLLVGTMPSWTEVELVNFSSNCLDASIPDSYETNWTNYDAMLAFADEEDIFGRQSNVMEDGQCLKET
jgi:hypothetical protein